jgi:hypothetical protein
MSTKLQEVQWSDLARDPKSVAALADNGDVRVTRRDGANLLLIREDRAIAAGTAGVTVARALRTLLTQVQTEVIALCLVAEFSWLRHLAPDELIEFIGDFVREALAAAELEQWEILDQVVREWKATALIHAVPSLARNLREPITDDFGPVPSPVDEE